MGWNRRIFMAGAVTALAGAALGQPQQQVTGPIAVYWMSALTSSGFSLGGMSGGAPGGPGAGRGGIPNIAAMMGGGGPSHSLTLQLGSSQRPSGAPNAEHLPPAALKAGTSIPLVTPQAQPTQPTEPPAPGVPQQYQQPRGRILIFWGCGERAPAGQPVVLDFATMTNPAEAARLGALLQGINAQFMNPPSPTRNATYGEWPNGRPPAGIPGDSSLVGAHTVRGNYSPQINFNLNAAQDFLAPLTLTSNDRNPGGWVQLGWNAVPNALGYFATVMGGGAAAPGDQGDSTVVLWSSSRAQAAAFTAPDYMSPSETNRRAP